MNDICSEKNLLPIPGFPAYASSPDGLDVWRIVPALRGPTAGVQHRMRPTMHPRGLEWAYQLSSEDGKRCRMPLSRLAKLMLDSSSGNCDATATE
jgi:hypothetical protein